MRLSEDAGVRDVLMAPGLEAASRTFRCLPIAERDSDRLIDACRDERIEFVVVGPEAPLASGVVDALEAAGVRT
ncbi:MAG: phosphoribosylamine--glycine ligase, partial [Gaiellaceae bacterium]